VKLGVVIATAGRLPQVSRLIASLAESVVGDQGAEIVVVDQSSQMTSGRSFVATRVELMVVHDTGRGASRARNIGWAKLSDDVTHVIWPNDHTLYTEPAIAVLSDAAEGSDIVVGVLLEQGRARYRVGRSSDPLDRDNVWWAIEPVTATSTRLLHAVGGWNEQLGAGAASPWQSSALADLLMRMTAERPVVCWEPNFVATGAGFTRGASVEATAAKARAYGRGYGHVLRQWDRRWWRMTGSVTKPLLWPRYRVGPDRLPLRVRIQLAVGRAEGVAGHLLPLSRVDVRRWDDVARS
jgi:hypothetical protein